MTDISGIGMDSSCVDTDETVLTECDLFLCNMASIFSEMSGTSAAKGVPAFRSLAYSSLTILMRDGSILRSQSNAMLFLWLSVSVSATVSALSDLLTLFVPAGQR